MMRTPASNDYDREKDVVKFSGDEPDAAMRFLDHDMDGQDYAELIIITYQPRTIT